MPETENQVEQEQTQAPVEPAAETDIKVPAAKLG